MTRQPKAKLAAALLAAAFSANTGYAIGANSAPITNGPNQGTGTAPADTKQTADTATERLLLLMDTDKNGKVSKQEFMDYMSAEFDRLDKNQDGALDVKELTKLNVRPGVGVHK